MKHKALTGMEKYNRVSRTANTIFSLLFIIIAIMCIIPLILVIVISFSSENSISKYGYQFIPNEFSREAYIFLWNNINMLLKAAGVSIFVTVVGTIIGILLTTSMGYVLSRPTYKLKGFFTWVVFIPMIFNGGLISTYFINSSVLGLNNSIWALILPLLVSSFNVIICKTFFRSTIPDSIVESAKMDGASQFHIFFGMILPISLPVIATIGLFLTFGYWNDWFQSLLYITSPDKKSLQALLTSIEKNVEYMLNNATTLGISQSEMLAILPRESFRMAIAVVIIVPISCAYPFFQKYFITGLTVGAVKG